MKIACLLVGLVAMAARADGPAALNLSHPPGDADLTALLWARSPDLVAAQLRVRLAGAELTRAKVWPNPGFDFLWATFPIGPTNPPGLDRFTEVPNYTFTLNQLVELGKRAPREAAARSAREAAALDALELLRQRWFDLQERIAEIATAQIRIAALAETVANAERLAELQRQRAAKGDIAGLDADRADLEAEKFASNLGEEREKLSAALLVCSQTVGLTCLPFDSPAEASAYLNGRLGIGALRPPVLDQRPDLRSLTAQEASAESLLTLAHNRWIPDPTFRFGYLLDQFTIAGNQHQSLFLGISFPLTFFDHGQADAEAATATATAASSARSLLLAQAQRDVTALTAQREAAMDRRIRLRDRTVPLAREVVERLESAVQRGGAPLPDLLLARRTLGELQLDAADLDLFTFRLSVARSRAAGELPPFPDSAPHVP
ncbi:MAG TPA: TolC family protein [Myxococcaceae bacterium]|nr:TolC family protein [Myxococcaceae bacterium]